MADIKKTKTIVVPLIGGAKRRIYKSEISAITEQYFLDGTLDVEIWMRSGHKYLTNIPKKKLEEKISQ